MYQYFKADLPNLHSAQKVDKTTLCNKSEKETSPKKNHKIPTKREYVSLKVNNSPKES